MSEDNERIGFSGTIERIAFYSEKNNFGAIDILSDSDVPHSWKMFIYNLDTNKKEVKYKMRIVGKMMEPAIGTRISGIGVHSFNPKYKIDQWEIVDIYHDKPKSPEENSQYLKSIVTERQAETLLSVYPDIVNQIISGDDDINLNKLPGIGQTTYDKIKEKVVSNFAISDILALLIPLGISFKKIQTMLDGEKNPHILRERIIKNPYLLTSIRGISFKTADKIAIQLNPSLKVSEERLIAFIKHHLRQIGETSGDTWILKEELKGEVIDNITECEKFFDLFIEKELDNSKNVFILEEKIGLKSFHDDEVFIYNKIKELNESKPLEVTQESIDEGIRLAEEEQGFFLTQEQRDCVINMTKNQFCTISGKAGVGKSSSARALLKIYEQMGYSIWVTAFSAKASVRATETTGFEGSTMHRLLGLGKERTEESNRGISYQVVFLDENSMIPLYLMKAFFKSVNPEKTKVIMSGDSAQLPPLGNANVFSDILKKEGLNHNVLTKIQRQAADSGIIVDANMIREGINPVPNIEPRIVRGNKKDLFYIFKSEKDEIFRIAVSTFMKSVKEKGIGNSVILVPFKKKSLNSTREFNKVIQREINFKNKDNKFEHGEKSFWLNDFVIHVLNDYDKEIFNGFTGFVSRIENNELFVNFDGREVMYNHDDIDELELAYSLTTWKYQGSEVKDAIIVMDSSHYILLSSQYLYTSLTRAKERAVIITDSFAFKRCLEEDKNIRRTWLSLKEID